MKKLKLEESSYLLPLKAILIISVIEFWPNVLRIHLHQIREIPSDTGGKWLRWPSQIWSSYHHSWAESSFERKRLNEKPVQSNENTEQNTMNDVAIDINNFCIICSFSTKKNKSLKIILGSYHEYEGPSCDYCSTQWSSVIRHVPAIQTFSTTELSFILYLLHGNSDIISRLSMRIRIILNISLVNLLPINE